MIIGAPGSLIAENELPSQWLQLFLSFLGTVSRARGELSLVVFSVAPGVTTRAEDDPHRWLGSWAPGPPVVTFALAWGAGGWYGAFSNFVIETPKDSWPCSLCPLRTTETRLELLIKLGQQCRDHGREIQHRGELTVAAVGCSCPQVQGSRKGDCAFLLLSNSLERAGDGPRRGGFCPSMGSEL